MNPFDQDFFTPNETFIRWYLSQHWLRYRRVIDCGAGRGEAVRVLKSMKIDAIGIDLLERPSYATEIETGVDATKYHFAHDEVVMICRPCHDGFAAQTYRRALHYGANELLYVGLEKNLEIDLEGFEVERVLENAGEDGEAVWRVYGPKDALKTFARGEGRGWGELRKGSNPRTGEVELRLYNMAGGYCPIEAADITETIMRADFDQIHLDPSVYAGGSPRASEIAHRDRDYGDKGNYGWIGPMGEWYPCGSTDHEPMLRNCFGITEERAAELGFIKAYGSFWSFASSWKTSNSERRPNEAQARTLRDQGYKLRIDETEERGVDSLSAPEKKAVRAATFKTRAQLDGD